MEFVSTSVLTDKQKSRLLELWNNEYPKDLCYSGLSQFEQYLGDLAQVGHILLEDRGQILGWYFDFDREDERWFAMILDTAIQGKGWGSKILDLAKEKNALLNGWVIDHDKDKKKGRSTYKSPLEFYLKNGFEVVSDQRLELDTISAVKIKWKKWETI